MDFLSKLPKLPFLSSSSEKREYFFALNISKHQVEGLVWGIEGKKMVVINTAFAKYSDEDELIEAANQALDEALADFEPEPIKILYGVPDNWLLDENLKPEYLKVLKRLSKELDVAPMAYVSLTHAISHLMQKKQGVPLTAILVEVADPVNVAVIKAGKVLASKAYKRSENLPQDIEKVLLSLPEIEVMPSKILIYGPDKSDRIKEELQSYSWMSQLPFLHLPKIEDLDGSVSTQALALAGASELNPEVTFSEKNEAFTPPPKKTMAHPVEDLGFVAGDIEEIEKNQLATADREMIASEGQLSSDLEPRDYQQSPQTPLEKAKALVLAPVQGLIHKKPNLAGGVGGGRRFVPNKFLFIPVVILILLVGSYIFFSKAKVDVFIDMQLLENQATVTADPTITTAQDDGRKIPGKIVEATVNGAQTGQASGKKQIGDPSKGVVVVYNKTSNSKSFSKGATLVGPNNLKFTLDDNIQIASSSAVRSGISFGSAKVGVTASAIGPDSNLPAGKELTIDGQSKDQFSAESDQAFSGGVSKDVTVVTADDQKRLLAALSAELKTKAQGQLQADASPEMKVLTESLQEQIITQTYSKKVGDQASEFNLNLSAKYKGTAYNENDLKTIVSKLVETNVPSGFELDLSKTETQADVSKVEKDGKLIFAAKFRAKLMPKLDKDQLKKDLIFKTPEQAATRLKEVSNVIGSNIELSPNIPIPFLQRLPLLPQNISLEVTAK